MKSALLVVIAALSAAACTPPPATPSTVFIRVLDEEKKPVPAAMITSGSDVISQTDPEGRAPVVVNGKEGSMFQLEIRCPSGYRANKGNSVAVRKFDANLPPAEYFSTCSRSRHALVVDVHADGGPNLPVMHLGKEIARTDANGLAHIELEGDVNERVELTLNTSAPELAKTHPQNPYASFEVEDSDTSKSFDVKFTKDKPPKKRIAGRPGIKAF